MQTSSEWIETLKEAFIREADAERAIAMAAYMKNKFSYIGLTAPIRKKIQVHCFDQGKEFLTKHWREAVELLWDEESREFQYTALDLLIKNKRKFEQDDIHILEQLIIKNSWWDTVDLLAGHLVGVYFQKYPEQKTLFIERWDESENMWLQRSVLIFQLKYKTSTDTELLFHYCRKYAENKEFFIRKAIGWALRELAKTNPNSVICFVNETQLSGLSKREALKHIKQPFI